MQLTVCGNLFHHAVEMFLKAALVGTLSVDEMRRKPYSHDLEALWGRFVSKLNDPALLRFEATIQALHAFETIRYPEEILKHRLVATLARRTEHQDQTSVVLTERKLPPRYAVCVEEIDTLIIKLLDRASINPPFFAALRLARASRSRI